MRIEARRIDLADMGRSGAAPVHRGGERMDRGEESWTPLRGGWIEGDGDRKTRTL